MICKIYMLDKLRHHWHRMGGEVGYTVAFRHYKTPKRFEGGIKARRRMSEGRRASISLHSIQLHGPSNEVTTASHCHFQLPSGACHIALPLIAQYFLSRDARQRFPEIVHGSVHSIARPSIHLSLPPTL